MGRGREGGEVGVRQKGRDGCREGGTERGEERERVGGWGSPHLCFSTADRKHPVSLPVPHAADAAPAKHTMHPTLPATLLLVASFHFCSSHP